VNVREYLASRAAETLEGRGQLVAAVPLLAAAGAEADRLLVSAEGTKALATREEGQAIEETVQTLGALSREIWAAHGAAIRACGAIEQLADVEARLRANLTP
jgi:hypothetical protein